MIDQQGRIAFANLETARRFGYLREELIGQPIEILVSPAVREAH